MVKKVIENFLKDELGNLINDELIYNEFSLQHELGIYLRNALGKDYKVQFERNVNDSKIFGPSFSSVKKEMDIYIFNIEKEKEEVKERYAIELKFPRNGQYPEQMYSFVKDIKFMEDVKLKATGTYAITLVENKNFYSGSFSSGSIYEYFRGSKPINGCVYKPTGIGKVISSIHIDGTYPIVWTPVLLGGTPYNT